MSSRARASPSRARRRAVARFSRRPRRARALARVRASAKPHVIICPGLGNAGTDYDAFAALLRARGHGATIVDVRRLDWLRNAAGAATPAYWRGTLRPRPTVDWYLDAMQRACDAATPEDGDAPLVVVAHSAGGWLARVFIDERASEATTRRISRLVTLGSPVKPAPRGVPGVVDQTRGILTYVDDNCRTASELSSDLDIECVCVAGRYARGAETLDGVASARAFALGQGYKQVCGRADVDGDGITPVESALMDGATHVVLDDVYHTPLGADEAAGRAWYGSPSALERWAAVALDPPTRSIASLDRGRLKID